MAAPFGGDLLKGEMGTGISPVSSTDTSGVI